MRSKIVVGILAVIVAFVIAGCSGGVPGFSGGSAKIGSVVTLKSNSYAFINVRQVIEFTELVASGEWSRRLDLVQTMRDNNNVIVLKKGTKVTLACTKGDSQCPVVLNDPLETELYPVKIENKRGTYWIDAEDLFE